VPGIDDVFAEVLVVDVPARNDDGVGAVSLRSGNACLQRRVDACRAESLPRDKPLFFTDTSGVPKNRVIRVPLEMQHTEIDAFS